MVSVADVLLNLKVLAGGEQLSGRTAIVETLLEAGMDPNCFDGASGKWHVVCDVCSQCLWCGETRM